MDFFTQVSNLILQSTDDKSMNTYANIKNAIVTPVYKETGELMRDILLKLMLADLEPV